MVPITNAEQAAWQRRAAAKLTTILDTNRELPAITWTVSNAGSTLVGQVSGPAKEVRVVFYAWCQAIAAEPARPSTGGGRTYLRASLRNDHVTVTLAATVVNNDGQAAR